MFREVSIKIIDKIRKPKEGNAFINGLLSVVFILLFPLTLFGGLIFLLFLGLFSVFQNLTKSNAASPSFQSELSDSMVEEQWEIWTSLNGLVLYQKFQGEIRYGPVYLSLKGEPELPSLESKTFGDWVHKHKHGLLLQQWNSTGAPDTNLVFIDTATLEVRTIEKNIPSVLWSIVETGDKSFELNCDTGKEVLKYSVEIQ